METFSKVFLFIGIIILFIVIGFIILKKNKQKNNYSFFLDNIENITKSKNDCNTLDELKRVKSEKERLHATENQLKNAKIAEYFQKYESIIKSSLVKMQEIYAKTNFKTELEEQWKVKTDLEKIFFAYLEKKISIVDKPNAITLTFDGKTCNVTDSVLKNFLNTWEQKLAPLSSQFQTCTAQLNIIKAEIQQLQDEIDIFIREKNKYQEKIDDFNSFSKELTEIIRKIENSTSTLNGTSRDTPYYPPDIESGFYKRKLINY